MSETLASLRKAKGVTQEELGQAIANRLERRIGVSYAQKKIGRFENGSASPTAEETKAMAKELGVTVEKLESVIASRAPHEGASIIEEMVPGEDGGRSLIASCMLSRSRPQTLDESAAAIRPAVEDRNVSIAVFVPYPTAVNIPGTSDHIQNLLGYYARVRRSILESNRAFKNTLKPDRSGAVVVYFPRVDILKASAILVPPMFRQYTLTFKQEVPPSGPISKALNVWEPGAETDTARPAKATGLYSVEEQMDLWQSFFGEIVPHWIATNELLDSDAYWEKVQ